MSCSVAYKKQSSDDSDLDILITLKNPIGVFALARLKRELAEATGRDVDLAA